MSSVHTPAYQYFLSRLVRARQKAGLTMREAAALYGRSHSFIQQSESGQRRVDVIELQRFAKIYRRSFQYFLPPSDAAAGAQFSPLQRRRTSK